MLKSYRLQIPPRRQNLVYNTPFLLITFASYRLFFLPMLNGTPKMLVSRDDLSSEPTVKGS